MEKLCTDQLLVAKLAVLFKETDELNINDAVAQAKNRLIAEKQSKRNDLEKLFDSQIATLKDRGVPEPIIEALQNQKGAVVEKASKMTISEGNIPFLQVIKPAYLGYYGLMAMVRNGSKECYTTYLKPAEITDQFETPDDLYYIYDVEDGKSTRGKSPQDAENIFNKQSRSPLTATEVVNLCIITDVLSRHFVWATGSRYESASLVPNVYLYGGGQPRFYWLSVVSTDGRWGSPSCGSR